MVTPTKYITAPDARPVGFLTYAHRRVPTKAPKSQVANGEFEDGRTDDQERENPDESAADHGGPGCVRCSQKGGVSAADESQTGHQSYGCHCENVSIGDQFPQSSCEGAEGTRSIEEPVDEDGDEGRDANGAVEQVAE